MIQCGEHSYCELCPKKLSIVRVYYNEEATSLSHGGWRINVENYSSDIWEIYLKLSFCHSYASG